MNKLRWWRYLAKRFWHETLPRKVAYYLPNKIKYYAAIHVGVQATTGEYSSQIVPELLFIEALERWDKEHGEKQPIS